MDAEPEVQLRLLELQALDSAIDRLAVRRRTFPALAMLEQLTGRLRELAVALDEAGHEHTAAVREQTRLENEVDGLRTRAARDQGRLESGTVSSSRELENLQSEIVSLDRRRDSLEDELLGRMETTETIEARLGELTAERDRLEAERTAVGGERDSEWAAIDSETVDKQQARGALAGELPTDLVTLYERLRASGGGVGAARLHRRRCEGCHLELSGSDLREVAEAAPELVLRCEECRRILVRTEESGL